MEKIKPSVTEEKDKFLQLVLMRLIVYYKIKNTCSRKMKENIFRGKYSEGQ